METAYNRIAGQNIERISALSDGIFAVAMTLLFLDLHVPAVASIHSEHDLERALLTIAPDILVEFMSMLTLGIFWVGQQTQLNQLARSHRSLSWTHIFFLFSITLVPFSTRLLADFMVYRLALIVYWFNMLIAGALLYLAWNRAMRLGLAKPDITPQVSVAIKNRIVIAQALYAFGALLCIIDTYVSIVFIVLIQLNYAIAPQFRRHR